ncbi:MAG: hypothetical protein WDO68_27400 [Gammaproteobacteria bacterium]
MGELPAARVLSADPQVHAFEGFVSPAACDWLIARARCRLTPSYVYDAAGGKNIISTARTNSVASFTLAEVELLDLLLQFRMSVACRRPLAQHGGSRRASL